MNNDEYNKYQNNILEKINDHNSIKINILLFLSFLIMFILFLKIMKKENKKNRIKQ